MDMPNVDVLVVGGGNAALCAAMTARQAGATVLLLESAPKDFRGGDSRHTRNLRYLHRSANDHLSGAYCEDEFWQDLLQVTDGKTNRDLALEVIRQSEDLGIWMKHHGCRFQPPMHGTLHLARTNAFFLGGGKALMNAYYASAAKLGVNVLYNAEVQELNIPKGRFESAIFALAGTAQRVRAQAVVVASGGFQANHEWLQKYWGPAAENFLVRGTPYNKGRMLKALLEQGAKPTGNPRQCHCVAIDARAPRFDGGIVTRLDCIPFGIVVNRHARRFYDEGSDFWPKRYAVWGQLVARQPGQIAYVIIDSKSLDLFMPSVFAPIKADSIHALALKLKLDPVVLNETVADYNQAVQPGIFDASVLDNCSTEGLNPPKSHWARSLDRPPFYGYPLRPGITFTYLGVTVDQQCRVIMQDRGSAPNIFAAGEVVAGNVLGKGYLAGFGMTIGTVFGRIAGREAARYAIE